MAPYADKLVTVQDESVLLYVDTPHVMKNGKPLFFGSVKIGKRYVSYHLMPVYVFPELLDSLSDALRARMQGKSCFNFRKVDEPLFEELSMLTEAGFDRYRVAGYLDG